MFQSSENTSYSVAKHAHQSALLITANYESPLTVLATLTCTEMREQIDEAAMEGMNTNICLGKSKQVICGYILLVMKFLWPHHISLTTKKCCSMAYLATVPSVCIMACFPPNISLL